MELVDDFAFPLPITVIAELLGIPVEDQGRFRAWSSTFVTPAVTSELQEQVARHTDEFIAHLDDLFELRREEPTGDLVSALVQAEDGGDHLSEYELYSMVVLLIVAGHETTVSRMRSWPYFAIPPSSRPCARIPRCCRPRSRSSCATTAPSSARSPAGSRPTRCTAGRRRTAATS